MTDTVGHQISHYIKTRWNIPKPNYFTGYVNSTSMRKSSEELHWEDYLVGSKGAMIYNRRRMDTTDNNAVKWGRSNINIYLEVDL